MPMSTIERSRKAAEKRSINAQRRRFQRYLAEMRQSGLVIEVQTTGHDKPIMHPDYTVDAVRRALGA